MSLVGNVKWFNSKKGFGFITVITPDDEKVGTDIFVHFSNINVRDNNYKRLFPGDYVSFNLGKNNDGRAICVDVTGVHGGPLLADNTEHRYKVYPKESHSRNNDETNDETNDGTNDGTNDD